MFLNNAAIRLMNGHLVAGIEQLDREASRGQYNTICIRALGNAATALGVQPVADRAAYLLRAAPDESFWAGVITNIDLPQPVPDSLRTLDGPEESARRHPPYREHDIIERIRSYATDEEHLALCLADRIPEARASAGSGRRLEEVGDTLAVLGDFDGALSVSRDPCLEQFRGQDVRFVMVIELLRRGRLAEADALLAERGPAPIGAWGRVHLALGCGGREPWGGYPYPDW